MNKLKMFCPMCDSPLYEWEPRRLETIEVHVCNPNCPEENLPVLMTYRCHNQDCPADRNGCYWDEQGALYINYNTDSFMAFSDLGKACIHDGVTAARGSFWYNIEFEQEYEKRHRFTIFKLFGVWAEVYFVCHADDLGKILSRGMNLRLWKKDKQIRGYIWWKQWAVFKTKKVGDNP